MIQNAILTIFSTTCAKILELIKTTLGIKAYNNSKNNNNTEYSFVLIL